ncbi:MAG TPA: M56 family metallopeptidase [Steroidobacteraceae bacterium]
MIYLILVTLLVSVAALAAERAARLRRAPCRWIWLLAMTASVLIPALAASVSLQVPGTLHAALPAGAAMSRHLNYETLAASNWLSAGAHRAISLREIDVWLQRFWILASSALAILLIGSGANLRRRQRAWIIGSVAGVRVYVAADIGPAVVGIFRPRIVIPHWLTELPDAQQSLVIAHEVAHLRARDPQALAAALSLLVCVPWNVPLWWLVRRLRRASEVDCDAGIVRSGVDAKQYGETLLAIGQRQSASINTVAAMSQPQSFLEERITIMLRKPSKSWALMAAAFSGLSLTLVAVATQVSPPQSPGAPRVTRAAPEIASTAAPQRVLVPVPSAVLDGYAGYYEYGEGAEFTTVKRESDHLMVEFPGIAPQAMYPQSLTVFFGEDTDAQVSFIHDQNGSAVAAVLHQNGASTTMRRIDTGTADRLRAATAAKVQKQAPAPGSEAMLRRVIDGIVSGNPNLQEMNPQLAAAIRNDLPKLQARLADLGAVQSIKLLSVDEAGMDVYEVRHERGSAQWSLALDSNGTLIGAMVPL